MPDELPARADKSTVFDAYVFVDWSASRRPCDGEDSIWIADAAYDQHGRLRWGESSPCNPTTRASAVKLLGDLLASHVTAKRRVLVGVDFPYGYPRGSIVRLGVERVQASAECWPALWHMLAERVDEAQEFDHFALAEMLNSQSGLGDGPYWGRVPTWKDGEHPRLSKNDPRCFAESDDQAFREYRIVEDRLRAAGRAPKSVWHLAGAPGVVGSQALVGIPCLYRLRHDERFAQVSQVWPFETGWETPARGTLVTHAEIWPGAITWGRHSHPIKDAAQMIGYVRWAAGEDVGGGLASFFDPLRTATGPKRSDSDTAREEGWILGFRQ